MALRVQLCFLKRRMTKHSRRFERERRDRASIRPGQPPGPLRGLDPIGPEGGPVSRSIEERIQTQRGTGAPLEPQLQAEMEDRFQVDFSQVRLHSDSESEALNRQLSAQAFTLGADIFLGRDTPSTDSQTIVHELMHVVQQESITRSGPARVTPADDIYEHLARSAAAAALPNPHSTAAVSMAGFRPTLAAAGPQMSNVIQRDVGADSDNPGTSTASGMTPERRLACDRYLTEHGFRAEPRNLFPGDTSCDVFLDQGITTHEGLISALETAFPDLTADPISLAQYVSDQWDLEIRQALVLETDGPNLTQTQPQIEKSQPQPQPQPTGGTGSTGGGGSQDQQPRLVIQIPITPIQEQLPLSGSQSALNQAYQPNIAAGPVYNFSRLGGFSLGGFVQVGVNTPLLGSARPLTAAGNPADVTGANVQGYLQPAYVLFDKNGYQISLLLQPGLGTTFDSPVPEENGVTYTLAGGFQENADIFPKRLQFFGTLVVGASKTFLDNPPPGVKSEQAWQPFIGIQIGIQPIIPLVDYPKP